MRNAAQSSMHSKNATPSQRFAECYFVASLPSIGREKATAILESYQTPLNALINVDDWEKAVHGLGPVITNRVKDVLNSPYKENTPEEEEKKESCEKEK